MNEDRLTEMLLHFQASSRLPEISSDADKRIFRELQRSYLLRFNSKGEWVITRKGEEALRLGVKEYIRAEKFEAELVNEVPRLKKQKNILIFLLVLLVSLLVFIVVSGPGSLINMLG